jgi:broad specificity phosphatase PhoE
LSSLPEIWVARHGETAWSRSSQHTGHTDLPLLPDGEVQAQRLGARLGDVTFAEVWTSPLVRARRTCELAGFGDRARVEDDLREWDYGEFEGLRRADIAERRPDWDVFKDGAPGGETPDDIAARADRVIAHLRSVGGNVLVVGHGHFSRALGARWIGLPVREAGKLLLSTASVSILGYEHGLLDPAIRLWNDTHHLETAR